MVRNEPQTNLSENGERDRGVNERDLNERLGAVLKNEVDAIIVIDEDGIVESANPATERIFGYAPEEIVGQNVKVLMPEPYRSEHDGYLTRFLDTGERRIIGIGREVEGRRKDGTTFPMELSVSEMLLGSHRMFTGIIRDMTAQRRAEEERRASEARLRAVLETAVDAIIVIDEDGIVESANPATERIFGYAPEEIVGQNVKVLMPEPYRSEHDRYLRNYLWSGERRIIGIGREVEGRRKDGTTFPMDLAVSEVRLGKRRLFTGIARDISVRMELNKKLIEQESLAKLGEMSAIVAHEVKNPLAGIIGATRMLGRRLPEESEEREISDMLLSRAVDLNEGVKDILAYSRPRTPEKTEIPLSALLESLVTLVSSDPEFAGIQLEQKTTDVVVLCDASMFQPVLLNLIKNAAQAMQGSGRIEVVCERFNSCTRVTVHDTGPGIAEDTLAKIFEPFFTTKGGGTGLGLPIAKRVVDVHGGEISISCPPEGGTRVVIELPLE